jgi:hypothetical protein
MNDAEILRELGTDSCLNKARRQFSAWRNKIEQANNQSRPLSPFEYRRMEFEAVLAIVKAYNDE